MRLCTLLVLSSLSACSLAARADAVGTSVTGSLFFNNGGTTYGTTNYFNPTYGYVPSGYGNTASNTVTIGPGVEFGFNDGADLDTANFTGTTLTVRDVDTYGPSPFEMVFTDSAFTGASLLTDMSGYSYTFSGHTLTVFFAGDLDDMGKTLTSTFSITTPGAVTVTPEPSSLLLLGTGVVGAFSFARRRLTRTA